MSRFVVSSWALSSREVLINEGKGHVNLKRGRTFSAELCLKKSLHVITKNAIRMSLQSPGIPKPVFTGLETILVRHPNLKKVSESPTRIRRFLVGLQELTRKYWPMKIGCAPTQKWKQAKVYRRASLPIPPWVFSFSLYGYFTQQVDCCPSCGNVSNDSSPAR